MVYKTNIEGKRKQSIQKNIFLVKSCPILFIFLLYYCSVCVNIFVNHLEVNNVFGTSFNICSHDFFVGCHVFRIVDAAMD